MKPDLDTNFGYLIYDLARLYRLAFNQRALPHLGLTQAQSRAMLHLARCEGTTQAALADLLEVKPITLARTLDRLESDGWITRKPDPNDRRAFNLYLADKSRKALEKIRAIAEDLQTQTFANFQPTDYEALIDTLQLVKGNLLEATGRQDTSSAGEGAATEQSR